MHVRTAFTVLACTAFAFGTPGWAQDTPDGGAGQHATSSMEARHGGQVQHTPNRAYELVRHERAAMLVLYTRGMKPIAVHTPAGRTPKAVPASRPGQEGVEASGTAVITKADGTTTRVPLRARKDAMTGTRFLHMELPADLGEAFTIQCDVRVTDTPAETVTFKSPALVRMHHPG